MSLGKRDVPEIGKRQHETHCQIAPQRIVKIICRCRYLPPRAGRCAFACPKTALCVSLADAHVRKNGLCFPAEVFL